jgi:hypothetical protein
LAEQKIKEEKYRDVVHLKSLFPDILDDPKFKEFNKNYLMLKLIQQNDVTTARLLISEDEKRDD